MIMIIMNMSLVAAKHNSTLTNVSQIIDFCVFVYACTCFRVQETFSNNLKIFILPGRILSFVQMTFRVLFSRVGVGGKGGEGG